MGRKTILWILGVTILLVLASLATIFDVQRRIDVPLATEAKIRMEYLQGVLEVYRLDNGTYPTMPQGLQALIKQPAELESPSLYPEGGYTTSDRIVDPWGRGFDYQVDENGRCYRLVSFGQDGAPGGRGEAADLATTCQDLLVE